MKVALFIPCYVDQVAPTVGVATVKLLRRLGCEVIYPREQTCCGQPAFNTGFWNEARELAERETRIFQGVKADAVVCPSGSCAAMQKVFYPTLLAGTPLEKDAAALAERTWELTQFLVHKLGVTDVGATFKAKAVLHPSCHSIRELGARTEARTLLEQVRGLELLPLTDDQECCGFGGTFSVKVADISTAMGQVKTDNIAASGADWVISGDSSCLMHLGGMMAKRNMPPKTVHLAEVLAATA
jgi:L-lactate dehydrogenase complex protein LldE